MTRSEKMFAWGNNCRLLGFYTDKATACLHNFLPNGYADLPDYFTPEEFGDFWKGYYSNEAGKVVMLDLQEFTTPLVK